MKTISTVVILFVVLAACCQTETKEYSSVIAGISEKRKELNEAYARAESGGKAEVIAEARTYLINVLAEEFFPCWYGTPWDFNGTSRVPGNGKIACGYFVTNVLTDAGFDIPRVKWAQCASEVMIRKFVGEAGIKRMSGVSVDEVEKYLAKGGDGLYLVGLDIHVGFVLVKGKKMNFIHSNYYHPEKGVMSEGIKTKNPLSDSKYRVFGKLFSEPMIINWLYVYKYE